MTRLSQGDAAPFRRNDMSQTLASALSMLSLEAFELPPPRARVSRTRNWLLFPHPDANPDTRSVTLSLLRARVTASSWRTGFQYLRRRVRKCGGSVARGWSS